MAYGKEYQVAVSGLTPQIMDLLNDVAHSGTPLHELVSRSRELLDHIEEAAKVASWEAVRS